MGQPAGQGTAALTLSATPNPENAIRTASVVVAGRTVLVVQEAAAPPTPPVGCSYSAGPSLLSLPAAGGTLVVNVVAPAGCAWTATSPVGWLVVLGAPSGQGSGSVSLSGTANPASTARSTTVVVAGQTLQVTQEATVATPSPQACTFEVSSPAVSVGPTLSSVSLVVTASAASCPWTVTSAVPWITPTAPGGSGTGQASLSVAANADAAARTGAVTIAGRTVQVTQAGAGQQTPTCTFSAAPTSQTFGADGGPGQVVVTASTATCTWTAQSGAPWITITGGAQGSGTGPVAYQVARNESTTPRTGTITAAGQVVTLRQEAAPSPSCTFTVAPTTQSFGADGGTERITVTASSASCSWTASAGVPWITVTSGAQGGGNGAVSYQVSRNEATSPRSGTIAVAGQSVTISQDGAAPAPCTYRISPSTTPFGPTGGTATTRLEAPSHCPWTATSQATWIAVSSAASGTGSAEIQITVAPNTEPSSRSGMVTIADQTLQVMQGGAAPGVVTFDGRIASIGGACPNLEFRVMGQDVVTDGATRFEDGPCSSLRNGLMVAVEGRRQPDGAVLATRVRILE